MKYTVTVLVLLLGLGVTACAPKAVDKQANIDKQSRIDTQATPPAWYEKSSYFEVSSHELLGFGSGTSKTDAIAHAKAFIAHTIASRVSSHYSSTTTHTTKEAKATLDVSSDVVLDNVVVLKHTLIDATHYVALKYAHTDFIQRVVSALGTDKACIDEPQNAYLKTTPLFITLNQALNCTKAFTLVRQNSQWYLKYASNLFRLHAKDFEKLFVSQAHKDFDFTTPQAVLKSGSTFYFEINATKPMYVTLLNVYASGITTLLLPSQKLKTYMRIPDKASAYEFEASTLKEGVDTYDLYVVLFSDEALNMSRFEYASEDLAHNEMAYKFDELIALMQAHEYATLLVRTKFEE